MFIFGKSQRNPGLLNKVSTLKIGPRGTRIWELYGEFHREDGPAIDHYNGHSYWYLHGKILDPTVAVDNPELKKKYPELINSMIIYLVHQL